MLTDFRHPKRVVSEVSVVGSLHTHQPAVCACSNDGFSVGLKVKEGEGENRGDEISFGSDLSLSDFSKPHGVLDDVATPHPLSILLHVFRKDRRSHHTGTIVFVANRFLHFAPSKPIGFHQSQAASANDCMRPCSAQERVGLRSLRSNRRGANYQRVYIQSCREDNSHGELKCRHDQEHRRCANSFFGSDERIPIALGSVRKECSSTLSRCLATVFRACRCRDQQMSQASPSRERLAQSALTRARSLLAHIRVVSALSSSLHRGLSAALSEGRSFAFGGLGLLGELLRSAFGTFLHVDTFC